MGEPVHPLPMLALAPDTRLRNAIWSIIKPGHTRPFAVTDSMHSLPVLALTPDAWLAAAVWSGVEAGHTRPSPVADSSHAVAVPAGAQHTVAVGSVAADSGTPVRLRSAAAGSDVIQPADAMAEVAPSQNTVAPHCIILSEHACANSVRACACAFN